VVPAETVFDVAILDYDGTLSDTRLAIAHCLQRAFAEHGRPMAMSERTMRAVNKGLPLKETCVLLDPGLLGQDAEIDDLIATYRTLYQLEGESLIKTFPGAKKALQEVHARGVRCIVVTNKGADAVNRSLSRCGLAEFVDFVLADQPGMPHKPDRALLTEHIEPKFPDVARDRMLMVGDTEVDIAFAKNAGLECCWATYGFGDRRRCLALGPEYSIESIDELPLLIGAPAT
jgi:phosphoglycolate phosphatase